MVGNLTLNEKIVISADMITKGRDQVIPLGTFCAYHKGNNQFPLRITTNEGGFIAKGLNNQGNLPYQILINKVVMPYNQVQSIQTNNHKFNECQLYESIAIKFSKYTIAKCKGWPLSAVIDSAKQINYGYLSDLFQQEENKAPFHISRFVIKSLSSYRHDTQNSCCIRFTTWL